MISILGIPYDAMSSYMRGPAKGPAAILEQLHSGASNYYTELGVNLQAFSEQWEEAGSLSFDTEEAIPVFDRISAEVRTLLEKGDRVLSLGGDHSIAFPIMRAFAEHYDQLNILQIDAHSDLYDHFEGNPYSHACPFARIMEQGLAKKLTQVGIRTLNQHQSEQAKRFNVEIIEAKDFNAAVPIQLEGPLYLSIDLDGLDPAFAPGVSHHEAGGLSTRDVLKIIHSIQVPIIGVDIVELNPDRDWSNMTAALAAKLLKECLGKMLRP